MDSLGNKLADMRESFGSVGSGGTGNSVQEYKEKAAELGSAAYNRASTAKNAALDWIAAMTSSSDPN